MDYIKAVLGRWVRMWVGPLSGAAGLTTEVAKAVGERHRLLGDFGIGPYVFNGWFVLAVGALFVAQYMAYRDLKSKHPEPDFRIRTDSGMMSDFKFFPATGTPPMPTFDLMESQGIAVAFSYVSVTNRGSSPISLTLGLRVRWKDGAETVYGPHAGSPGFQQYHRDMWRKEPLTFPLNLGGRNSDAGWLAFLIHLGDTHVHGRIKDVEKYTFILNEHVSEVEGLFEPGEFSTGRKMK